MYLKQHIQNGLFSFSKKKNDSIKGSERKESTRSHDDGSTVSMASTILSDDDMSSSLHKSSTDLSLSTNKTSHDSLSSSLSASINSSLRSRSSVRNATKANNVSRRKKVCFDLNKIEWNFVECYLSYSSDLWWSREEVKQRQTDMGRMLLDSSRDDLERIRRYSNAYHNARRQSIISKHEQKDGSVECSTKSKVNISNEDYKIIVQGKAAGWDGAENFFVPTDVTMTADKMVNGPSSISAVIVASYQDIILNKNIHDSDRQLRSIAKSLTLSDRSWAVIMGRADRDAVLLAQKIEKLPNNIST